EALIRYLRRDEVAVRLYRQGFLHAKAYLCFADRHPGDRFVPVAGIVGSGNFTRAGLTTNQELLLTHKTTIPLAEADDAEAQAAIAPLLAKHQRPLGFPAQQASLSTGKPQRSPTEAPASNQRSPADATDDRQAIKSEVGARAILELLAWYETRWAEADDFKQDLIDLLNESKFGAREYTPYEIYLKTLYTYFRDELQGEGLPLPGTRSAVELTRFQEDAVKRARRILARYDGVMIADSVGLGKTWIGKKLLEDTAYHRRQKALVICPASLREMWRGELLEATISADILSQEMLGRDTVALRPYMDADVILIDESHNFRNHRTNRYDNLERLIGANGGRGRDGERKKIILLTATPINNTIFDLYNQIMLFAQGDRAYFAGAGIGDLRRFFLDARRRADGDGVSMGETAALFNLLEEVVIRRTRPFIREAYPKATIRGKVIQWPTRRLRRVSYDLESTYAGIYQAVVTGIESLHLTPYNLEAYKRSGLKRDEMELGRQSALVGIFKTRFLKRFESSVEAFRISIRRALAFLKTFRGLLEQGRLLDSATFQHALRYLELEGDDLARELDLSSDQAQALNDRDETRDLLEALPELDAAQYDLDQIQQDLAADIAALTRIWERIAAITPDKDAKLARIKQLLSEDLRGQKVLVFTYYKDTARYLTRALVEDPAFLAAAGEPRIARIDGDVAPQDREPRVARFAPIANDQPELAGTNREIDVLISTDVLSEGQNLQDCGHLVNYDLHWNPTRMIQRAGRIDRIGSAFDTLWITNVFPEEGLERLLGLVQRLNRKLEQIDQAGLLDTSVLGEIVHPRNFNTLQRIAAEDDTVLTELEARTDLVSNEFLLLALQETLARGNIDLANLPDGIHSGRACEGYRGLFFYLTAPAEAPSAGERHFWRYYDLNTDRILDNRYEIATLIRCGEDEPRVIGQADVFEIQERIINHILRSVQHQQAVAAAPKILDPLQQTVATVLQQQRSNPAVTWREVKRGLKALRAPLSGAYLRDLRDAYKAYQKDGDIGALLKTVQNLHGNAKTEPTPPSDAPHPITREDLHLVCWEYVWS
ncbi:MAG: helicase, partial [Anaerolineae bacterium]|nr:helicase [Anaerolineae bacterium]